MNNVVLMGRLTKDVELRYNQSQMAIGRFTVAVNRRLTKEKRQEAEANNHPTADFISCVIFGKQAEVLAQYVSKGMRILINGRIQTGSYDNNEGQKVYTTEVIVEQFEFIDSNNQHNEGGKQQNSPDDFGMGNAVVNNDSEMPF